MLLCRQFWRILIIGLLDLVICRPLENYWQQQVLMTPLPYVKMMVVIFLVFLLWRVMRMKLKVSPGVRLARCSRLVVDINQFGYGKCYRIMGLNVFRCYKNIHRMLKWYSGILQWIFCSRAAMTIRSRSGRAMQTMMTGSVYKL